jgi:hypothetical protein
MNYHLTITADDETGTEAVRVNIGEIDPLTAALTVMEALQGIKPRRPRSDKGTSRKAEVPA